MSRYNVSNLISNNCRVEVSEQADILLDLIDWLGDKYTLAFNSETEEFTIKNNTGDVLSVRKMNHLLVCNIRGDVYKNEEILNDALAKKSDRYIKVDYTEYVYNFNIPAEYKVGSIVVELPKDTICKRHLNKHGNEVVSFYIEDKEYSLGKHNGEPYLKEGGGSDLIKLPVVSTSNESKT